MAICAWGNIQLEALDSGGSRLLMVCLVNYDGEVLAPGGSWFADIGVAVLNWSHCSQLFAVARICSGLLASVCGFWSYLYLSYCSCLGLLVRECALRGRGLSELSLSLSFGGDSLIAEFIDLCVSHSLSGVGGLRSDMV